MNKFFPSAAKLSHKSSPAAKRREKRQQAFAPGIRSRLNPAMAATVAVASLLSAGLAPAAGTLYWDGTDTNGNANGGSGTWDLATASWDIAASAGASSVWNNDGATTANFGGTAGTVTMNVNRSAQQLFFSATDYTLTGAGTLSLGGGGVNASGLSSGTTALNNAQIVLSANQSWSVGGGATLASNAVLSGSGSLTKSGAGTLALSGNNTWTGGTTISQGEILVNTSASLPGNITMGDANTGTSTTSLTASGGVTLASNITVTNQGSTPAVIGSFSSAGATVFSGALTLNRDVYLLGGADGGTSFTGKISGSSSGSLFVLGQRVTLDNAANDFTGNLSIGNGAILQSKSTTALPATASVVLSGTGSYQLAATGTHAINGLNGAEAASIVEIAAGSGASTLSLGNNGGGGSFAGVIRNGGATLSLTKSGAGTQTLSGPNTYTGATTVSGGTLALQGSYASPSFTIASGAVLELNAATGRDYVSSSFSGAGTLRKTGAGGIKWSSTAATFAMAPGSLIDVQEGVMVGGNFRNEDWTNNFSNLNVATGAFFVTVESNVRVNALTGGGTVSNGYPFVTYANLTIGVDNGGGNFSGTMIDGAEGLGGFFYGGVFTPGNLNKIGTGTQILSGTNTYTGTTTVSGGILQANVNNALGTAAGGTTVANGATLRLNGINYATAEALTINGAGFNGAGALAGVGTSAYAGQITAATNATISTGGGTLTLTGGLVKNGRVLTLAGGGTVNVNSAISGASANSDLIVDGTTANLNAANTYNGPTFIRNGGTLNANAAGALPAAARTAVTFDGTGTSTLNLVGSSQAAASLTSALTTATVNLNGNNLTVGAAGGTTTFAGAITGAGSVLTKDGASTQVLSGANTYTGGTNVTAGNLLVNNTAGSGSGTGAVTVAVGGTLGGTGSISNSATINGTLAPGDPAINGGIESLAIGTLLLNTGSVTALQLQSSSNYDQLLTTATTNNGGTLNLNFLPGFVATVGDFFRLLDADFSVAAFASSNFGIPVDGQQFAMMSGTARYVFEYDYNGANTAGFAGGDATSLSLLVVVPEPSRAMLLLLAGAGIIGTRRRRRG